MACSLCTSTRWCDQCRQLAARAGLILDAGAPPPMARPIVNEKVFQDAVMRTAREAGWTFLYHTYRSTNSMGGFPDLVLCHREPGHVCYAVELKTDEGQVSAAQQAWLQALSGSTGVVSAVWRPSQWQELVEQLRG
jgi:VRR-NUC domain